MVGLLLDELLTETTVLWWLFLMVVWKAHVKLVGYKGITTFTLFMPYLMLTNGVLVPIANQLAYEIVGIDITLTMYGHYWRALALMYGSLLLGIALANVFRKRTPHQDLHEIDVLGAPRASKNYVAIVAAISIISIVQIYAKGSAFDLASYVTMQMDRDAYIAHRYEAGFTGWQFFVYNKLPYGIAPLAIILWWNARGISNRARWAFILVLAFAIVQTGHKMPVIAVFGFMIVSRALITRNLVLTRQTVLLCAAMIAAVVFAILPLFYLMQGQDNYVDTLLWSVWRVFLEQSRVLQLHFEVYPNIHPFLDGASTGTIATIMGVPNYVPPSVYIPVEVFGDEYTSFPALFIGEGWADFGYFGVFGTSVVAGFMLQMYNVWFYSQKRPQLEESALFLSIVFGSYHLMECNLFTTFFTYGMLSSAIIYIMIKRRAAEPIRLLAPERTP
jgi:hypothetical protein